MSNLNEIAPAPAGEQPTAAIAAVTQLECFNPSRKYIGTMEPRERGTYVRREDVERRDAARAAAGVPAHEQDLLDIVRTLCSTAQRLAELSPAQRANYPSPLSPMSPLLQAAITACVERGYTRWGLAIEGAVYPAPAAHPAPAAAGLTKKQFEEIAESWDKCTYDGIDIGDALRRDFDRLASLAPVAAEPGPNQEDQLVGAMYALREIAAGAESVAGAKARAALDVIASLYASVAPQVPTAAEALEKAEAAVRALATRIKELPERTGEQEAYNEALEHAIAAIRDLKAPEVCAVPPAGWNCTRKPGHDGPCAARPDSAPSVEVKGEQDSATQGDA